MRKCCLHRGQRLKGEPPVKASVLLSLVSWVSWEWTRRWGRGRRKSSKGGLSYIICQGEGTSLAREGLTRCWEHGMKPGLHWSSSNSPLYQLLPWTRYIVFLNSLLEIRQRPAGESSTGGGRINEKRAGTTRHTAISSTQCSYFCSQRSVRPCIENTVGKGGQKFPYQTTKQGRNKIQKIHTQLAHAEQAFSKFLTQHPGVLKSEPHEGLLG